MLIENKIKEMGYELPEVAPLVGEYVRVKQVGNQLYVSGQGPTLKGVPLYQGKVGGEVSLEDGYAAARCCALNALSALKEHLGDLDKIKRVVKTLGFVASADGFYQQPKAVDGASVFLHKLYGDEGVAARSAIGVFSLPANIPVEVEFIFEI